MKVEDIAHELVRWSKATGLMGPYPTENDISTSAFQDAFSAIGLQTATNILRDRGISYIGINEESNEVLVFCEKVPRIKDRKSFDKINKNNITIRLLPGGHPQSGHLPPPRVTVPPFTRHNGRYTCGSSIHLSTLQGAGTLGCLARGSDGSLFGLTNNHVIAGNNYASMNLPIFAPGSLDIRPGQDDPFVIGHLSAAYTLIDGLPEFLGGHTNLDAAIMKISDADRVSSNQRNYYDSPAEAIPLRAGMSVEKIGRTTGRTIGTVNAKLVHPLNVTCNIPHIAGKKLVFFEQAYIVTGVAGTIFSAPGDSGSLVTTIDVDGERKSVGLVFAGDDTNSMIVPIDTILNHFGLTLVSGLNV